MAGATIRRDDGFRVKRAIANIVEMGSGCCEFICEVSMQNLNVALLVEASRDTGLVGHDKREQPAVVQRLDCRSGSVDPAKAFK